MRKDSGIKIIGSLNPQKEVQDRVRVLSLWGSCQSLRATDYKDPTKILIKEKELAYEKNTYNCGGDKRVIEKTKGEAQYIDNNDTGYRIRKLTPKECWRLMGFSDEAFEKAKAVGISDSQLYKQAGNSIVTDVLYYIFKELYVAMPYLFDDLKVGSYFSGIGAFEIALNKLFDDINTKNFQTPQVNCPTVVD